MLQMAIGLHLGKKHPLLVFQTQVILTTLPGDHTSFLSVFH